MCVVINTVNKILLPFGALVVGILLLVLGGCTTQSSVLNPRNLAQSAVADTHLGWKPAPAHELNYSLATSSGIARMEVRELPLDLQAVTIELPGMRNIEGVQWRAANGAHALLFDGVDGMEGVTVERQQRGYRLQVNGPALESMRSGGMLTVIDYHRN
ncbi:hypothetical protein PVT68_04105 [Microbulbifer bruguierae]|uniref:Lipoprotein n=1 Tax=Microbulbifer bruguierae TaxID=3029061 RepID=A0ABY8NGA6_9GAMM|nr:hypothetical protein [Microbulbifer bruguierae]WGL17480.1 hypothetical protein PVT68_04105 [Microbulbifer bruguierae]